MKTIEVKTGFGYFKNQQGRIIAKAELPAGDHPLKDGFTYTEVSNQAALDKIEVYQEPEKPTQTQDRKIREKLREIAIIELTKDGNWP